jgi:hypothetical protein
VGWAALQRLYDRGHDGGVLFAHNVSGAQLLEAGNPWAIPLTVCASWPVASAGSSVPLNVQWAAYNGAMCPGATVPTIGKRNHRRAAHPPATLHQY